MTHFLHDIVPPDCLDWRREALQMNGRLVCTARRNGTTIQFVRDAEGWWHITRFKHGRVWAEKTVKNLPCEIAMWIDEALPRRQRERLAAL